MSVVQIRPIGGDEFYSPNRDLAYNFTAMFREAMASLESDEVKQFMADYDVAEEHLRLAADMLRQAHELFVEKRSAKNPREALEQAGWYTLPVIVRYLITSRIGESMLAAYFLSMEQVQSVSLGNPKACHIEDFVAACRELTGAEPKDLSRRKLEATVEVLENEIGFLVGAIKRMVAKLEEDPEKQDVVATFKGAVKLLEDLVFDVKEAYEDASVWDHCALLSKQPLWWWLKFLFSSQDTKRRMLLQCGTDKA